MNREVTIARDLIALGARLILSLRAECEAIVLLPFERPRPGTIA